VKPDARASAPAAASDAIVRRFFMGLPDEWVETPS
jgi:hypothetical protein